MAWIPLFGPARLGDPARGIIRLLTEVSVTGRERKKKGESRGGIRKGKANNNMLGLGCAETRLLFSFFLTKPGCDYGNVILFASHGS